MKDKKIITTDVDFVLLDWVGGLTPFFEEKGLNTDHLEQYFGSTYYPTLQELFFIEDEKHCIELMKEFNASPHIAHLPIFQQDSVDTFKELVKEGFEIHAVTCVGDEDKTHKMRTRNLMEHYGDVFSYDRVHALPVRTSKEPYLKAIQNHGNIIMFIDDRENHLQEAKNLNINPVLYSNDGKTTDCEKTTVISCLKEVKKLANKFSITDKLKQETQQSKSRIKLGR